MEPKTIELMRIISNWILIIALLSVLIITLMYRQDVQEAMSVKEPVRLMQLYEKTTNTKCLCAIPEYGSVIYIPNKN